MTRLDEIKARSAAATPGPWAWEGHIDGAITLATRRWGRYFVMRFVRKGMQGAEPMFQRWTRRGSPDDMNDGDWRGESITASQAAVPQVDYRDDVHHVDNADAILIAHSRADLDWLVERVEELAALVEAVMTGCRHDDSSDAPPICDIHYSEWWEDAGTCYFVVQCRAARISLMERSDDSR